MARNKKLLKLPEHHALCGLLSGDNDGVAGISDLEIQHLAWLATQIPTGGDIVEIGSHRGKSTCALAAACRHVGNNSARIFAVDLWTLGAGRTFAHYNSDETWQIFHKQMAEIGVADRIRPVRMASVEASKKRRKPIHLLFIDASHRYPDVLADMKAWAKFVAPGGWIVFHDYTERFPGVMKVVDELVIPSGLWDEFGKVDRLFSARRKA